MNELTIQPNADLKKLEAAMAKLPQVACPLTELFTDGVYWREITIPAGTLVLGHLHKTEHINVLLQGTVRVMKDGEVTEIKAPYVFVSPPGVQKLVFAVDETKWANVHHNPKNIRNPEHLEAEFIQNFDEKEELPLEAKMLLKG